jgi:AcrR family transcriptional regulator
MSTLSQLVLVGWGVVAKRPSHQPAEPGPGRRELARQETERLIKATALTLFSEQGFDATTTKQIAEAAGMAHGTVFLIAATKEALLVKVLEEQLRQVVQSRAASLPRKKLAGQLVHVFDGLFDLYARNPPLSRAFFRGIMFFSEPISRAVYDEHVARFTGYLASLFDAAAARGELGPRVRSDIAATNVIALYVFLVVAFLNGDPPDRAALDAGFRAGLDELFHGLPAPARRRS